MKLPLHKSTAFGAAEFYRRDPENFLLLQRTEKGGMLICATADNLTPTQQEAFIQYLCAEGFVVADSEPLDCFEERRSCDENFPVRWMVGSSWRSVDPVYTLYMRRLCLCTLGIFLVWSALMIALVFC